MTNKYILLISLLSIATYSLQTGHKETVFRGSKSEIVFGKEKSKLLTGILYIRENMIGNIEGDISNIQVEIVTNSTDIKEANEEMKEILDKMKTQLITKEKLVNSIVQTSRPFVYRKDKEVYLRVNVVLEVLKSYPIKVNNIVEKVREFKAKPISIRYSLSQNIERLYRIKMLRLAAFKSNNTANVLSKVMKQKVVGIQNVFFNSYVRRSANIPIGLDNKLYLRNNRVVFIVNIYVNYYIQEINPAKK